MFTLIIFGLFYCLFVAFIFGLIKAGRKADIDEEKIFLIISQETSYESELPLMKGSSGRVSSVPIKDHAIDRTFS